LIKLKSEIFLAAWPGFLILIYCISGESRMYTALKLEFFDSLGEAWLAPSGLLESSLPHSLPNTGGAPP
jgi:hypothetical protein